MCLSTDVTFLVLLTCLFFFFNLFCHPSWFLLTPHPHPYSYPITFILFFLPSFGYILPPTPVSILSLI